MSVLKLSWVGLVWGILGVQGASAEGTASRPPADLYKSFCSGCHEGAVPRAPHAVRFQMIGPSTIYAALNGGVMQAQGSALSLPEKRALAEFLGGAKLPAPGGAPAYKRCANPSFDLKRTSRLSGWGMTLEGTRAIDAGTAKLSSSDVKQLQLKWAFAFPGASRARSQPMVAGGNIFVGSQDGTVYSLDLASGCVNWTFQAETEVRNSVSVESWKADDATAKPRLFFGDLHANAYAVDARSGALLWKTRVDPHPNAQITGAPRLYRDRLYVPLSSNEWAAAADPVYECCTFRGGVAALTIADGKIVWHSYTIPETPQSAPASGNGTARHAPAGAPVWNTPTIDVKRNRLYVGSGESYTSPAAPQSDAVLAYDLTTGKQLWWYQSVQHDAWNMACFIGGGPNCPLENGPDLDIGAPPILHTLPNGKQVLLVGHKSADIFALDPDNPTHPLWKVKYGRGGYAGGVHWGMAASATTLFAPNADTIFLGTEKGEAKPGLFALDPSNGKIKWFVPAPDVCPADQRPACDRGFSPPPTVIPQVVFQPSFDGWLRAYAEADGSLLWEFNTLRDFQTVSGEIARGGSIESVGATVADGNVLLSSGYLFGGRMPGNVLLVFSKNGR